MFVDGYEQQLRIIWFCGLLDFEERRAERGPPVDDFQESNLCVFWRHASVLVIGSHDSPFPVSGTLQLYQVSRYELAEHLPVNFDWLRDCSTSINL